MPLPFILAGVAVVAGLYGAKKSVDAYDDNQEANSVNSNAQNIVNKAEKELRSVRTVAHGHIENLGTLKFRLYENAIIPFIETFSKIKNIEHKDGFIGSNQLPTMSATDFKQMHSQMVNLKEIVGGGIASLGAGGLAGLAAYGGVGALASASTGTAIGTLGGAAATNATLAWLGGGSLAAGGYGMAGGMMVLGGIVAGPVLAIGGAMFAAKAEAAKEDAYSNLSKANLAAAEMKKAAIKTKALGRHFQEMYKLLLEVEKRFMPQLGFLQSIVQVSTNYPDYSEVEKRGLFITTSLAKTLKNLLEVQMLTESGSINSQAKNVIRGSRKGLEG